MKEKKAIKIGEVLEKLRRKRLLSQEQLAETEDTLALLREIPICQALKPLLI